MLSMRIRLIVPLASFLVIALGAPAQTTAAAGWIVGGAEPLKHGRPLILTVDDEALSHCPPGSVFQKKNGNRRWCVETTPEMYGGGQAKDTEVLVPEESSGPSPFGDQKATGTEAALPTLTFPGQ